MSAERSMIPANGTQVPASFEAISRMPVPYSQEAEEAVIGSVLINPNAFVAVSSFLQAEDFYILRHIYIWQALGRLSERDGVDIDYLTLQEELRAAGQLKEVGGPAYLIQLTNNIPTSMHAENYGRLVERAATRRRLIQAGLEIAQLGFDGSIEADVAQIEAYQKVDGVRAHQEEITLIPGAMSMQYYDDGLEAIASQIESGEMVSYPTPESWGVLHEAVPMTFPGDFMVVSGPPGSGKSAFCECWAEYLAGLGVKVLYIFTEMKPMDILHRRMARHSGLGFDSLKAHAFRPGKVDTTGKWQKGDYGRVLDANMQICHFADNLAYLYAPNPPFKKLAIILKQAALGGVQAIFMDHFQDVRISVAKGEDPIMARENAVTWLQAFAEIRNMHFVVASQETNGSTKWTKKLIEKAVLWASISRPKLKQEMSYWLEGIEYRSLVGEYTPFPDVFVHKARFGKTGKRAAFYHGPRFQWLDKRSVQAQKATATSSGKSIPIGQIPFDAAAEV